PLSAYPRRIEAVLAPMGQKRECPPLRRLRPGEHSPHKKGSRGASFMWNQIYDPFGNSVISTIIAAVPAVFLLALIATGRFKIHIAAVVALAVAVVIAIFGFTMPT